MLLEHYLKTKENCSINKMLIRSRNIGNFFVRRKSTILICSGFLIFCYALFGRGYDQSQKDYFQSKIKYNLMEDIENEILPVKNCTLEYANTHRLQQDHPCVLELIKKHYLKEPFSRRVPYGLHLMKQRDPSAGQSKAIMRLLRYKKSGFFVECGASDGEHLSNTLYMERFKNWTGLLIEPDPESYKQLLDRKRKAWHFPACLSLETYPTQVTFKKDFQVGKIEENSNWMTNDKETTTVQCFPFYSILLASGRKKVDFFSLDVEGHELKVLKTIPWHKIDIRTLAVEWEHVEDGAKAIIDFMESNGFVHFGNIATSFARDLIFIVDYLRDLRDDYDEDN